VEFVVNKVALGHVFSEYFGPLQILIRSVAPYRVSLHPRKLKKNCIFQAFANVGFNLIPWGLLGELYPTAVAGLAGGITTCLANMLGFAAIKLYPGFQDLLRGDNTTTGGGFFFFGAVACVGTVFIFLFLPETFKKSLEQIG
jgi:hypothetical protein